MTDLLDRAVEAHGGLGRFNIQGHLRLSDMDKAPRVRSSARQLARA